MNPYKTQTLRFVLDFFYPLGESAYPDIFTHYDFYLQSVIFRNIFIYFDV